MLWQKHEKALKQHAFIPKIASKETVCQQKCICKARVGTERAFPRAAVEGARAVADAFCVTQVKKQDNIAERFQKRLLPKHQVA